MSANATSNATSNVSELSADEVISRLKTNLKHFERETMTIDGFRQAAVLVPLLRGPNGFELLFTVRAATLANHAGQISFPGGRSDPGETLAQTARRETLEEVGLRVEEDDLLGELSELPSPARYVVTPIVGVVDWPQPLTLNRAEVEEAFTVPLSELRALKPRTEIRYLEGMERTLFYYPWRNRLIWGMTGNVLKNFLDVLEAD